MPACMPLENTADVRPPLVARCVRFAFTHENTIFTSHRSRCALVPASSSQRSPATRSRLILPPAKPLAARVPTSLNEPHV